MNIARMFASAVVRRLAFVLVAAVLAYVGIGKAHAQVGNAAACTGTPHNRACPTEADASAAVMADGPKDMSAQCNGRAIYYGGPFRNASAKKHQWVYGCEQSNGSISGYGSLEICTQNLRCAGFASWSTSCPVGTVIDHETKSCVNPDDKCRAHNNKPGFKGVGQVSKTFLSKCIDGCTYGVSPGTGYSVSRPEGGTDVYNGHYEWTGACPAGTPNEPKPQDLDEPKPQECQPVAGQTMCVKKNGEHCYSTATKGATNICWKPGETGEKATGPDLQARKPGLNNTTPPPTPPPGESFNQPKPPINTTTTNVPGGGGSNTVINTTVVNVTTTNGTDGRPGTPDAGTPADGSGGNDPAGDGEPGSVTGGGDCKAQPQVSGGDPLLANIILQAWGTRCAQESDNAVKSTGDIGDCAQPFTIEEGTDANIAKLKALRAQICPMEKGGDPKGQDGTYGTGDTSGEENGARNGAFGDEIEHGAEGLDMSGFGYGRTCPALPVIQVLGHTLDFNGTKLCDWITLGGQLVLILAALVSLRAIALGAA